MFQQGGNYRNYFIERVFDTPFGSWGVSSNKEEKVYLQHVPLLKPPPQRLIRQYLLLDHPLIIPYLQVYQESNALVFVRPYISLKSLTHCSPDEETVKNWCDQLFELGTYLEIQPIPMKPVYHLENIGITDEGELRVFLCGNESFMQWDFSNLKTFREILAGGEQKGEETKQEAAPPPSVRKPRPQVMVSRRAAILGAIAAGTLCFGAGLGLMKIIQKPEKVPVQAEASNQKTESPAPAPKLATDPAPSEDFTPTQEDMEQSQTVAKEFVSSLDRDEHQVILKKRARSMTVLPNMETEQIDSRPGEITWDIEAEVFHSDGNMKGEIFKTVFRVVTVKENGGWQVKDAEVTEEVKE